MDKLRPDPFFGKLGRATKDFFSYKKQTPKSLMKRLLKYCLVMISILFSILFVMLVPRYLYTPPAMEEGKTKGYLNIVKFIKDLKSNSGSISFSKNIEDTFVTIDHEIFFHKEKELRDRLGEKRFSKFRRLLTILDDTGINSVSFDNNFVAFSKKHFIFESPGVLFSINGKDPNIIEPENRFFIYKPFEKIYGDWYLSRRLHQRLGTRYGYKYPVPYSIFDNSLEIPKNLNN